MLQQWNQTVHKLTTTEEGNPLEKQLYLEKNIRF